MYNSVIGFKLVQVKLVASSQSFALFLLLTPNFIRHEMVVRNK